MVVHTPAEFQTVVTNGQVQTITVTNPTTNSYEGQSKTVTVGGTTYNQTVAGATSVGGYSTKVGETEGNRWFGFDEPSSIQIPAFTA